MPKSDSPLTWLRSVAKGPRLAANVVRSDSRGQRRAARGLFRPMAWTLVFTCSAFMTSLPGGGGQSAITARGRSLQRGNSGNSDDDWAQHNYSFSNARYSPLDEINSANVSNLALKWSYPVPAGDIINQVTPIVLNGVMYFNSGSKLFAVNAATGE